MLILLNILSLLVVSVGQPDGVSVAQKEDASDATETAQVEETPQVNGEKMEKESPDVNEITSIEEKATDEKPNNANEVGFKKIFSIVGLKFTLKKDKSDEVDPVKLLIVKDKEGEEVCETEEAAKDKEATEKATTEEKEADTEASATEADKAEATDAQLEDGAAKAADKEVKEEGAEREAEASSPSKDTGVSSFRKFFSGGLFSNLRKKTSMKKTKDEEEKETAVKEETATTEEAAAAEEKEENDASEQKTKEDEAKEKETQDEKAVIDEKTKEENDVTEKEIKEEKSETQVEKSESEPKEDAPSTQKEAKSDTTPEEKVDASAATDSTTETKQEDQKLEEKVPAEATSEAEHQSSPEKSKPHGSPLKKLFTGAGLKKLSTKRHKNKKESESKPAESGEHEVEQLQSSNESEEAPKTDSGPSSPEASGEHVIAVEVNQNESSQEHEGEATSDGEKKKDGVIASFRKLVSPKKYTKRSSDSEDEGTSDKLAKSATLSSSESAPLEEKVEEKETKEDKPSEEEPKTENTEKLTSSTEEPKKKMDTSVSWEALMCMGGPKKRTRKTSDSDDEDTKAEEEAAGEKAEEGKEEGKTEDADVPSQSPENEEVISPAPEHARESTWSTLKRLVMPKNKPKSEEKPEEPADQVQPDTETQKEESSFSLKKLFHGRRKKVEKQASADQGSGEEDSDTPAVVPLSEYEEQAEAGQEAPAEPASVQAKVSADDRSPSWIPAVVEDDKHDQLSDIPEEVENLATPKSVDTDIADDDTDDQVALPKGPSSTGCKLSMAEVKPFTLAPAAATSCIPQGLETQTADEVVSKIEAQVSEVPAQTSVTLEDALLDVASAETETEMENAKSVTKAILEPHAQSEVVAICTGLETKETEDVSLEHPIEATVERIVPVSDVTSVEMAVEQQVEESEEAATTEDPVHEAQVHLVQTLELEPVVEKVVGEDTDVQTASESYEAEIEKVGVVGTENSEVIQPTLLKKNSPNIVMVDSIIPTAEMGICTQTVEVSEVIVETKESNVDMERHAADGENTPAEEVIRAVARELSTTECDAKDDTKGTEAAVPVDAPSQESAVITETVVLVAPDDGKAKKKTIQEQKTVETSGKTEVSDSEIETQSAEIAEAIIKDAVGKVLEDVPQSEKSMVTIPTLVKAMATTDIATEPVVSTETPVLVFCEQPSPKSLQTLCVAMEVTEAVPLEVTQNIKEEKAPKKSLKMAAEVEVSKETIIEEEVTEIGREIEQPQEKESKEVKDDEDVKSQVEESKPEEMSENVREIHMPTQVVLQSAEVVEELPVEVETVAELDEDGPNTGATSEKPLRPNELSDLPEEPQETASGETLSQEAETEKTSSEKCAEVMAQVIEVIEEAVKEIEPVSTEVTTAS